MPARAHAYTTKRAPSRAGGSSKHAPRAYSTNRPRSAPLWSIEQVRERGERELRRLASVQGGFILREQLYQAGFDRGAIAHRIKQGSLRPHHRGVYLVGHDALAPWAREMAAALLTRGFGVVSHRSAAAVWGILDHRGDVELTLVGRNVRSRRGLRTVRARSVEFTWRHGVPVTTPARTIVDLANTVDRRTLERALSEVRAQRLCSDTKLRAALQRARPGVGQLRALLDAEVEHGFTRVESERRLRALIARAELPTPSFNVRLHGYEADALWPELKLIVEVDGYGPHGHRSAFEYDRRRDQVLAAAGYTVIHVTWRQLVDEPMAVAVRLAQAIVRAAAPG